MAARDYYAEAPGRTDEARMRNADWARALDWAGELSDRDLGTLKRLNPPGDVGMAVEQEHGRRRRDRMFR